MELHSMLAHFPVALFISSFVFAIIGLFFRRGLVKDLLLWNMIVGLVASFAALYTGLREEHQIIHDHAIRELLVIHKRTAYIVTGVFFVLTLWIGTRKRHMRSFEYISFVAFLLLSSITVCYEAYSGAEMVFQHGAGVKPVQDELRLKYPQTKPEEQPEEEVF